MVEGVLTSCYASVNHELAHFAMTPFRWYPEINDWIFGEDKGFQVSVNIAIEFGKLIIPQGLFGGY